MSLSTPAQPQRATVRAHGLEWLPAPSAPPDGPSQSSRPRPLVVILPWMWAARTAISRHAALYHSLGCDVALFSGWPPLSVWLPSLARRNASVLLAGLAAHLRDHPQDVLIACFSGAAKGVLAPMLELLFPGVAAAALAGPQQPPAAAQVTPQPAAAEQAGPAISGGTATPVATGAGAANSIRRLLVLLPGPLAARIGGGAESPPRPALPAPLRQPPLAPSRPLDPGAALLRSHLRGVLFDSGPVDFDSNVGVRLFATASNPTLRSLQAAAGSVAAGALDFCLYEAFESQRKSMWVGLRACLAAARLPVLFLYSWQGDALADPQPIHALAVALRSDAAAAPGAPPAATSPGPTTAAAPGAAIVVAAAAATGDPVCTMTRGPVEAGGSSCGAPLHGGAAGSCSGCEGTAAARHGIWPTSGSGSSSSSSSTSGSSSSSSSSSSDTEEHVTGPLRSDSSHPDDHAGRDNNVIAPKCTHVRTTSVAPGVMDPRSDPMVGRCGPRDSTGGCGSGRGSNSCQVVSQPVWKPSPPSPCPVCRCGGRPARGLVRVWEQGWDVSGHVAHLRQHPDQYRHVVHVFLDSCRSRGGEGPTGSGLGSVSTVAGAGEPASKV